MHPKNMQLYIQFDRGYELAYTLLADTATPDRPMADFLINCISADLQRLGVTTITTEELNRRRLEHLEPGRKKQMQRIVGLLSRDEDKIAQNARPLARLLAL